MGINFRSAPSDTIHRHPSSVFHMVAKRLPCWIQHCWTLLEMLNSLGRSLTLITLVCEKNRVIYLPQFNSTQPRLPLMFRGRSRRGGRGEGVATPFSPLGSRKCRKFTVNALFLYPHFQNFLVYLAPWPPIETDADLQPPFLKSWIRPWCFLDYCVVCCRPDWSSIQCSSGSLKSDDSALLRHSKDNVSVLEQAAGCVCFIQLPTFPSSHAFTIGQNGSACNVVINDLEYWREAKNCLKFGVRWK